jgi:hypothetical protein
MSLPASCICFLRTCLFVGIFFGNHVAHHAYRTTTAVTETAFCLQIFLGLGTAMLAVFLFLGFNAFTDTRATVFGIINAIITFACIAAIDTAVNGREDSKVIRDKIVDVAASVRLDTQKELKFFMLQIKMGTELVKYKRESEKIMLANYDQISESSSENAQNDDVYKVRQNIARHLVLADRMQTFDTTKIWTLVPNEYGVDDNDKDANADTPVVNARPDEQAMWEWASSSTIASHSTVRSGRTGSSSGVIISGVTSGQRIKSRRGSSFCEPLAAANPCFAVLFFVRLIHLVITLLC